MRGIKKQQNFLRGKKAQHQGKSFEETIIRAAHREGIAIKKSDPALKTDGKGKFWRLKSGADFVIGHQSIAVFFDCKSLDSDRISHSQLVEHQLKDLSYWQSYGFKAGYLVWFRELDVISFIPVNDLLMLSPGHSIKAEQCINLGNQYDFSLGRLFSLAWEKPTCVMCSKNK